MSRVWSFTKEWLIPHKLDPLPKTTFPEPPSIWKTLLTLVIVESLVLGNSIGFGEASSWPNLAVRFGGDLMWVPWVFIIGQAVTLSPSLTKVISCSGLEF